MTGPVTIPGGGTLQLTVTSSAQGQVFSFSIPSADHRAVVKVIVQGMQDKVYIYDETTGFPGGTAAAGPLHAPVDASGKYESLSHIDFYVIPTKYA